MLMFRKKLFININHNLGNYQNYSKMFKKQLMYYETDFVREKHFWGLFQK